MLARQRWCCAQGGSLHCFIIVYKQNGHGKWTSYQLLQEQPYHSTPSSSSIMEFHSFLIDSSTVHIATSDRMKVYTLTVIIRKVFWVHTACYIKNVCHISVHKDPSWGYGGYHHHSEEKPPIHPVNIVISILFTVITKQ